jgi:hypothetical protein
LEERSYSAAIARRRHLATIVLVTKATVVFDAYVIDALMPDLVGHDRRMSGFVLYLAMARRARGDGTLRLSLQSLAMATGLSKTAVQRAILHLQRRGLIRMQAEGATDIPTYTVLRPWQRG